jgi:hypothetical protein
MDDGTNISKLLFFWFSQPGEKDIPLDRNGKVIPSHTSFLDTWEVSGAIPTGQFTHAHGYPCCGPGSIGLPQSAEKISGFLCWQEKKKVTNGHRHKGVLYLDVIFSKQTPGF